MTPATTEAPRPDRPSARFWAGLAVLTILVVGGSWGAAHRGAGPWAGWGGPDRIGPGVAAARALDGWGMLLALVPVASLLLVRRPGRAGVVGCATAVTGLLTYLLLGYPFGPVFVPVVVAVLLTAAVGRRLLAWSTAAALASSGVAALALRDAVEAPLLLAVIPWLVVLVMVGEGLRVRRERRVTAQAAQAARLQSLAAAERLGIARELHDVLAHSLSAINVQAGVGLHLMDSDPGQARASLQAVKDTSKQALEEVRGVIGALRRDGDAPHTPTPGLDDVALLLEEASSTGVRVQADVAGVADERRVPPRVGAAVYRIVQEALTNVRRHASRPEAVVTLAVEGSTVVVTVRSPRPPGSADRPAPAGHGLTGMRERAQALGGRLRAGPEGSDFVVHAELPLDARP